MPSGVQVSPWLHPGLCPFLHLCADAAHASLLLFRSYLLQPPSRPLFFPTYLLPSWPPCRLWPCLPLSLSLVSVSSPHPTGLAAEEGHLAGLATSCHLFFGTQTWEGGAGAASGPWACWLGCGRRRHGKGVLFPLSRTGPSLSLAATFLPSLLPPPSPSPVYTPQIRTGCYHGS